VFYDVKIGGIVSTVVGRLRQKIWLRRRYSVERHFSHAGLATDIGHTDTTFRFLEGSNNLFFREGFLRHFLILSVWASGRKSRLFSTSTKHLFETFLLDRKTGLGSNRSEFIAAWGV
jgi:hypothetical protein